jgi:carbamoyl-phosphate synthase large subunit
MMGTSGRSIKWWTPAPPNSMRNSYFYSTYEKENEAEPIPGKKRWSSAATYPYRPGNERLLQCSFLLGIRDSGFSSIMVNSNPETVSTDFDTSSGFILKPWTKKSEDILENENGYYCQESIPVVLPAR